MRVVVPVHFVVEIKEDRYEADDVVLDEGEELLELSELAARKLKTLFEPKVGKNARRLWYKTETDMEVVRVDWPEAYEVEA